MHALSWIAPEMWVPAVHGNVARFVSSSKDKGACRFVLQEAPDFLTR